MRKHTRLAFYLLSTLAVILVNLAAQPAQASTLVSGAITLADSRPSTAANETAVIVLSASNTFATGETIVYDWPAGFTFPANGTWVTGDFTFNDGSARTITSVGAAPTCNAGTDNVSVTADQTNLKLTVTACATYTASGAGATVTFGIGNTNKITNATAATYQVNIDETTDDAKDVAVAIVAGVTVSATVDETLTVAVNGVSAGASCDDNGGTPNEVTTTSTTVPFSTVSTETFYNGCQRIDVDTNAAGGYTVTVQQTQLLTGPTTIAEGTCDGTCSDTTLGGWEDPTNNGFGYCADDRSGNAAADAGIVSADQCDDATPLYYTFFTQPTAPTVDFMFSAGAVSGDQTNVSFHLSVPGSQTAGTYQNVMVYVATPTF